jgi:hypothetical protein
MTTQPDMQAIPDRPTMHDLLRARTTHVLANVATQRLRDDPRAEATWLENPGVFDDLARTALYLRDADRAAEFYRRNAHAIVENMELVGEKIPQLQYAAFLSPDGHNVVRHYAGAIAIVLGRWLDPPDRSTSAPAWIAGLHRARQALLSDPTADVVVPEVGPDAGAHTRHGRDALAAIAARDATATAEALRHLEAAVFARRIRAWGDEWDPSNHVDTGVVALAALAHARGLRVPNDLAFLPIGSLRAARS